MVIYSPLVIALVPLVAGCLLDFWLGDPRWLPHPVVAYGRAIALGERILNHGASAMRFISGTVLALGLVMAVWFLWSAGLALAARVHPYVATGIATLGVFTALAGRTLVDEGRAVFRVLDTQGLAAARRQLSRIVGRDTATLDAQQVRTAALETMAENLSDGVVAPLFWYALGGVPAMMAYKMINTLDSMIGHRDARYEFFGKTAARLDDVANFIPARLTALLMAVFSASPRAFSYIFRYGHAHASPNSGYPEAALAGMLNTRFGGAHLYDGELVEKPYIGATARPLTTRDVVRTAHLNHAVCIAMVALVAFAQTQLPIPFLWP